MLKVGFYALLPDIIEELRNVDTNPEHPITVNKYFIKKGYLRIGYILTEDYYCKINEISLTGYVSKLPFPINNISLLIHNDNFNLYDFISDNNLVIFDNFNLKEIL